MSERRESFAAIGFGVTFCLAAVVLLLQELNVVQLRWSIVGADHGLDHRCRDHQLGRHHGSKA